MDLNKYVLEKAIANGICEGWAKRLGIANKEQMMDMYVKGIDFCLEHNFPSNTDLLNLVGPEELANYGVYVNAELTTHNNAFIVTLGTTKGTCIWDSFNVGQLYVKHTSSLQVVVSDNAFVVIDAFDMTSINVTCNDNAKVLVNLYGQATIQTEGTGTIKVINKNKPTY